MKVIIGRQILAVMALFVLTGLTACSDDSDNNNGTFECESVSDCGEGERCADGECTSAAQSCTQSSECAFGQYCVSGSCASAACASDAECSDAICVNDLCRSGCSDVDDCGDGETCNMVTRLCEVAGCTTGSCPQYQSCNNTPEIPECRYTGDCNNDAVCAAYARQVDDGNDYICSVAQQTCVVKPPCGADSDCVVGEICEPRATDGKNVCKRGCRENNDCSLGQICAADQGYKCVEGCDVNSDCGENEVCDELICVETCSSRADCADVPGYICTGNPRVCQACSDNSQCPATQFCDYLLGGSPEEELNPSVGLCVDLPPTCPPDSYGDNHDIGNAFMIPTVPFDPMGTDAPSFCRENTGGEWFAVQVNSGDVIEVELTYPGGGNLDLALRQSDGLELVTSHRPPSEDNGSEFIRYGVGLGATLYIQVRGAVLSDNLEYNLRVEVAPAAACNDDAFEPNNTEAEAQVMPAGMDNIGLEVCGTDPDFYLLQVGANQVFQATVAAPVALGNVDLILRDSAGAIVAQSETDADKEMIEFSNEAAEDFTLEVRVAGAVGSIVYDFEWTTRDNVCSDQFEQNDTCGDATVLGDGTYTGLAICSDPDFYAVDLLPLQTVTFKATYDPAIAAGDLDITLFGPNDCATFIASESRENDPNSTAVSEVITYQAQQGGRYNLLGSLFAGINVPYVLDVEIIDGPPCADDSQEPDDDTASSTTIDRAQASTGDDNVLTGMRICDDNSDWMAIDLLDGDVIQWEVKFNNAQGNLDAFLVAPDGVTVLSASTTDSDLETVSYTLGTGEAGTYYLRVEGKFPARADYWVLTYINGTGPTDPACPDDYENNDDAANAAPVPAGSYGLLVCGAPTDDDWFSTTLVAGDTLDVELLFAQANGNVEIILYDDTDTVIAQGRTNTDNELVSYATARDQTVKWRIFTSGSAASIPYTMNVSIAAAGICTDDASEPNDDFASATNVEAPGLHPLYQKCEDDVDFFKIALTAGQDFEAFTRYNTSATEMSLTLYDPSMAQVATNGTATIDGISVLHTPTTTGTYFLEVNTASRSRIAYDLMLYSDTTGDGNLEGPEDRRCPDEFENNDTVSDAASIAPGLTEDLLLCWEGGTGNDMDYYSIYVPAGATVDINILFSHALGDLNARLYQGTSTEIASSLSLDDNETLTYTNTGAGQSFNLWVYGAVVGFSNYYAIDIQLSFTDTCMEDLTGSPSLAAATVPTASGAYDNLQHCEGTEDWFLLPAGTTSVEAYILSSTILGDLNLALVDATGTVVMDSTTTGAEETINLGGLSGAHYLRVSPVSGGFFRNGYDLYINADGDGGTTDPYCPDEFERNDDTETAAPLNYSAKAQYPELISCGLDEDWYMVSLTNARTYRWNVFFDHNAVSADLAIKVLNSSGTEIFAANSATSDEKIAFVAPGQGVYYLVVTNEGTTPGAAEYHMQFREELAARCPKDSYEPNDTLGLSKALPSVPGFYSLGSCAGEAEEYFTAIATSTGSMTIEVFLDEDAMTGILRVDNYDASTSKTLFGPTSTNRFVWTMPVTAGDVIGIQFSNGAAGYDGYFLNIIN